jgi:hypothetical protein
LEIDAIRRQEPPAWPAIWPGYAVAVAMLVLEVIGTQAWSPAFRAAFVGLGLAGFLYWIAAVRRLHQVLAAVTGGTYPISPGRAALYHFVPVYDLYWILRWPYAVALFVNSHTSRLPMSAALPGMAILAALAVRIFVDAALGTAALFAVLGYLVGKTQEAVLGLDSIGEPGP